MRADSDLMTIVKASQWASEHLEKKVTPANISYLIQYGRVTKHINAGTIRVSRKELLKYYESAIVSRKDNWKAKLGDDVNWALSFDHLKEADTTKHVHRLHPYKGKYIPQLVEYFIDSHTDDFKREVFFQPGDVILDPFCGSGTTLVQANELGLHAVGNDISAFNALISNIKVERHNLTEIQKEVDQITKDLKQCIASLNVVTFEKQLQEVLTKFNTEYFPSPDFKVKIHQGLINPDVFGVQKEKEFRPTYAALVKKFGIKLKQASAETFLDQWYLAPVRDEIAFVIGLVNQIEDAATRRVIQIILSRTIRSCRATAHADLGTLIEPVTAPYYCAKHGKLCKPLFSILRWWERYSKDTLQRLATFDGLRTETQQYCLTGDSTQTDILQRLQAEQPALARIVKRQKIAGIFSSPPYVGLIDYHEQHAYAYELFGFPRQDESEIGAQQRGQGRAAQEAYIAGIAAVLRNCRSYLADDFNVFLVANDKFNLYPQIAERADMRIVEQFKRPVLNRTERDKAAYAEIIFRLKGKVKKKE